MVILLIPIYLPVTYLISVSKVLCIPGQIIVLNIELN